MKSPEFYQQTAREIEREFAEAARERASKNGRGKSSHNVTSSATRSGPAPSAKPAARAKPKPTPKPEPRLIDFSYSQLERHVFEHRRPILLRGHTPILREGHIGELFGTRGIGKSWMVHTLAFVASTGHSAMGFQCEEPVRVLLIDGEMAGSELQERFTRLEEMLGIKGTDNLRIVAADWQEETFLPRLDTKDGQRLIEPFIKQADFIIIDNRSSLFDPESEKDPTAWQPAQNWLLSLRRRRKAVLLVHHSNRQGGARGHSKPEDILNLLIKLTRPDGYSADAGASFLVEFDKTRGIHGADIAPFTATLQPDGWHLDANDESDRAKRKLIEYLDLAHKAGDRPKSATAAISQAKVQKAAGLRAWAELKKNGLRPHPDGGFWLG